MYDPLRAKAKMAFFTAGAFVSGLGIASGLGWTGVVSTAPALSYAPQIRQEAVRPALDLSEAFVAVAEEVTSAVVRIEARRPAPEAFRQFFEEQNPGPMVGGGSGFLVSSDGYILTNDHVVSESDQVLVYLTDGRYFDAEIVGTDPFTDVAVIKIEVGEGLPSLSFGDSETVRVGEWVLAVGNPGFGAANRLDYTVTAGIVSARGRGLQLLDRELRGNPRTAELAPYAIEDFIQTDAVINPGNSGGPMVDLQGRVIGINSAIASETGYYQGYGFAVPINLARRVMEDLVEYGHVRRALLGVNIRNVTPEDAELYGLPSVSGALIQQISGQPAMEAGLEPEDVIVSVDGQPVAYPGQLQYRVSQYHPGDRVTVTVYRGGAPREITVRLGEAPINDLPEVVATNGPVAEERIGISVEPLTPELAERYGYPQPGGIVITGIQRASPANRRGLVEGHKIVTINGAEISSSDDVRSALASVESGEIVNFRVELPNVGQQVFNVRMPGM